MAPHTLQGPNLEAQQEDAKTPSKQSNDKGTQSLHNTLIEADTKTNEGIEPSKSHKEKKERVKVATASQTEKVATAADTQGRVMSKKERRAMKKRA